MQLPTTLAVLCTLAIAGPLVSASPYIVREGAIIETRAPRDGTDPTLVARRDVDEPKLERRHVLVYGLVGGLVGLHHRNKKNEKRVAELQAQNESLKQQNESLKQRP